MALVDRLTLPDPVILDPNFYVLMDSHLDYFRTHPKTSTVAVSGQMAEKYTGDFSGLLDTQGVDKKYHYLITRLNGLSASNEYDGKQTLLIFPDLSSVARVITLFNSKATS